MKRQELITRLLENMGSLKRGMYGRLQPADCPVSRPQLEVLFTIRHLQPISFKALARQLNFTPGFISQLAEGLEAQDFIIREADPHDRRIQCLKLSKKGQKILQSIEKQRHQHMQEFMKDLTDDELATWLKIQEKIIAHFQKGESK